MCLLFQFHSPGYQVLPYASHALMYLEDARLLSEDAIEMLPLDAQPLPHHCSANAPPMNFGFGLAIHLFRAKLLSWICLPLLVRRKEEHPHIGASMRTCRCCPTVTCFVSVCSLPSDLQGVADTRALLASSLSVSHG
jgi:hypothetical protein